MPLYVIKKSIIFWIQGISLGSWVLRLNIRAGACFLTCRWLSDQSWWQNTCSQKPLSKWKPSSVGGVYKGIYSDTDEIRRHFLVLPSSTCISTQPTAKPCSHLLHLIVAISATAATVDGSQRKYSSHLSCPEFVSSIADLKAIWLARVSAKCTFVCITLPVCLRDVVCIWEACADCVIECANILICLSVCGSLCQCLLTTTPISVLGAWKAQEVIRAVEVWTDWMIKKCATAI